MPNPQGPVGFIPQAPQPAPLPPDGGQAFQPWDAVPDNRSLSGYDTLEAAKGHAAFTWSQLPGPDLLTLFNPKDAPVRGMFSSVHASALSPGQFPLLQNVRFDDGTISGRYPTVDRSATGFSTGAGKGRGMWCGSLNGTQTIIAAVYDGAKIALYESTDGIAFTLVTNSSSAAAYKDTRIPDTGRPLTFGVVTDPVNSTDYLVIQNGTDEPRVYSRTAANGEKVRIHKAVTAPTSLGGYAPTIGAPCHVDLTTGVSVSSTGTSWTAFVYGPIFSYEPNFVGVGLGTDTAADTATIQFGSTDFSSATQLCLAFGWDTATDPGWIFKHYKIEIFSGSWQTVYDPASGSNPYYWYETERNGVATSFKWVGLFTIDVTALSRSAVTKIRLTAAATTTWGSIRAYLLAAFGGTATGAWPNSDQSAFASSSATYLVSYTNSGSRAESAGVVLAPPTGGSLPAWTSLGAQDFSSNVTAYGQTTLPFNTRVAFGVSIPFVNPSSGERDTGVDTLNIYRLDDGATDYLFACSASLATWGGASWSFVHTGGTGVYTQTDTAGSQGLSVSRIGPDAYAQTLPAGSCIASANGRCFVGASNAVWVSEYGVAWRFRPFLAWSDGQPVERSATKVTLSGETCVAFAVAAASALASSTVFLWTDRNTYSFSGFDGYALSRPTTLAALGCGAAGSVQVYKDAIFFLDTQGQLRRFSYGGTSAIGGSSWELMRPLSRRVVDDRTTGIPTARLPWCSSAIYADRYYLAYSPSGATENTRLLVWDEYVQGFCEDTCTSEISLATATLSSRRLLIAQGSDGKVYTHEDPTSSTAVAVTITFPELHQVMWQSVFFGRFGVVMDVQSGQSATVTKTVKPNRSDSTTINLSANATGQVWRWDNRSGAPGGQSGVSCQISLAYSMTPGTRLYAAVLERMPAAPGADA